MVHLFYSTYYSISGLRFISSIEPLLQISFKGPKKNPSLYLKYGFIFIG